MNVVYTIIVERYDRYEREECYDDLFQFALDEFKENMATYATSCRTVDDNIFDETDKATTYTIKIEHNVIGLDEYFRSSLKEFREKMAELAKSCKVTEDVICR